MLRESWRRRPATEDACDFARDKRIEARLRPRARAVRCFWAVRKTVGHTLEAWGLVEARCPGTRSLAHEKDSCFCAPPVSGSILRSGRPGAEPPAFRPSPSRAAMRRGRGGSRVRAYLISRAAALGLRASLAVSFKASLLVVVHVGQFFSFVFLKAPALAAKDLVERRLE